MISQKKYVFFHIPLSFHCFDGEYYVLIIIKLFHDIVYYYLYLRDQLLEPSGLRAILPCFHLVRTIRLNGSRFDNFCVKKLIDIASEVVFVLF